MRLISGALLVLLSAPAWAGNTIGYAAATGYFKKDSRPTLYQPLNLLDGRDATAWCSPTSDPLGETISFGFKGAVKIEELKITTGNNFDEHTFQEFARAKKLQIKSGKKAQSFTVLDQRGAQTITFNPPLEGSRFILEVLDQYPAEDPDQPVCMTDVVFVAEGKPLNGPWLTTKLKYDKNLAPLMGSWYAGFDGTPDRFLSFFFDGTFRYSFEPFDATRTKEKAIDGSFEASLTALTIQIPGTKGKVQPKYLRDENKKGTKGGYTLTLDGEVPEDLKGTFRSVP
jgi:hypothetical protein